MTATATHGSSIGNLRENKNTKQSYKMENIKIKEHNVNEVNVEPFYSRWFKFDKKDNKKDINIYEDECYEKFEEKYLKGDVQNENNACPPSTVVTKCVELKYMDSMNGVGLWEVTKKE